MVLTWEIGEGHEQHAEVDLHLVPGIIRSQAARVLAALHVLREPQQEAVPPCSVTAEANPAEDLRPGSSWLCSALSHPRKAQTTQQPLLR